MSNSVSVIIPSYNRKACLSRALESVLRQTRQADEIIVVDDGSTDGTAEWLARHYPAVRCVRHVFNLGVSAARNTGIGAAQGDWLALLDSDDEWHPVKLATQLETLQAQPSQLICHTNEIWIRNGTRVNPMNKHKVPGGDFFKRSLELCLISPSSAVIHKKVFETLGLFDTSLLACEDYDFWLRVLSRFEVCYIDQALLNKYGGHSDQLSKKFWGMDRMRIRAIRKLLASDALSREQREAALGSLVKKCHVLIQGAQKRQRSRMAAYYTKLKQYAKAQLGELCL